MTTQNVRLTTINIALMALLIAALAGVGFTQVGAQEDAPADNTPAENSDSEEFHECDFFDEFDEFEEIDSVYEEAAKMIGIDEESFWAEIDSGKSIADIAKANGVDPQTIIDAQVAEELKFIDELLADGAITAEEADEWKADSAKYIAFEIETAFVDPFTVAQNALGLDEETFWTELENGKSVAQLAQDKGIDPQTIIDSIVAGENEILDKEVAAGLITAEEADEYRAEIAQYVTDSVNMTLDELDAQFEAEWEEYDFDDDDFDFEDKEAEGEGE